MPDDRHTPKSTEAERQARKLAALLDEAGDELERNGPVGPAELRQRLEALEAAFGSKDAARPKVGKPDQGLR